ncbi:unnamed protein product [Phaeothamnion confervicola]
MVFVHGKKVREVAIKLRLDEGWTRTDTATTLLLSRTTVARYVKFFELYADFFSLQEERTGRRRRGQRVSKKAIDAVWILLAHDPMLYLEEVVERLRLPPVNERITVPTLCRMYGNTGITRQKLRTWSVRRSDELVEDFREVQTSFFVDQFVFIDETGKSARNIRRTYGRGLRNARPTARHDVVTGEDGKRYNAIAALTTTGVPVPYIVEGSVNADIFLEALRETVIPILQPYNPGASKCVVVMDNASIHHDPRVRELIESAGALLIHLPPYAPELNPIEWVFSLIKQRLTRTWRPGSRSLRQALADVLVRVTPENARAFIRNVGYTLERGEQIDGGNDADILSSILRILEGLGH